MHTPRKKIDSAEQTTPAPQAGTVSRERYASAVDEIDHLRSALREAQRSQRSAEAAVEETQEAAAGDRKRAETAIASLERLHDLLSS